VIRVDQRPLYGAPPQVPVSGRGLTRVGRTWAAPNWVMLDGPEEDFPQLLGFKPSPEQFNCYTYNIFK
jgi:hypothetical protein